MSRVHEDEDWDRLYEEYAGNADFNPTTRYRTHLILSLIQNGDLNPGSIRVLDVGCGAGTFARELKEAFPNAEILGIDKSRVGVAHSLRKVPMETFFQQDLLQETTLPEKFEGWATFATCAEVLEHIDDPEVILKRIKLYLSAECRLLVTVPSGPMSQFYRFIGHRRHYAPADLRMLLEKSGYEVIRILRAGFPFFNLYRILLSLRGRSAIEDAASKPGALRFWFTKIVMSVFSALFRLNLTNSPFGWQLVAVARKKLEPAAEIPTPFKKAA